MLINGLQLCIGCMHTLTDINECPHCGLMQTEYAPLPRCLIPGTKLANRYMLGRVLGEGSFGITYIGWDEIRNIPVAIKEYYPSDLVSRDVLRSKDKNVYAFGKEDTSDYETQLQKFYEEAQNLSKFNHLKNIVSVYDFFYENQTAYIVMNYIEGISLKEYVKKEGPIEEAKVLKMMEPVLLDMQKVHEAGLIHRDISPSNILIDANGNLIVIDFGAARITNVDLTRSLTLVFKRGYSPEEQYRSDGKQGYYTDVYSLCAVMYYMLTAKTPLEAVSRMIEDTMESLSECKSVSVSRYTAQAIMKGLAIKAPERWQDCKELHEAIYEPKAVDRVGIRYGLPIKIACAVSIVIALILVAVMLKPRVAKDDGEQLHSTTQIQPIVTTTEEKLSVEFATKEDRAGDKTEVKSLSTQEEKELEKEPVTTSTTQAKPSEEIDTEQVNPTTELMTTQEKKNTPKSVENNVPQQVDDEFNGIIE